MVRRVRRQTGRTIWRPSYVPQCGQTVCGGLGCRQARFEHAARVGAVAFHWDRLEWVLDRDILRLGTATLLVLLFASAQPLLQFCLWTV